MGIGAALAAAGTAIASVVSSIAWGAVIAGAIKGAIIGAVVGGLTSAVTGGDIGKGILTGAVGGLVTGGIMGGMSAAPSGAAGAGTSAVKSAGVQIAGSGAKLLTTQPTVADAGFQPELEYFSQGADGGLSYDLYADAPDASVGLLDSSIIQAPEGVSDIDKLIAANEKSQWLNTGVSAVGGIAKGLLAPDSDEAAKAQAESIKDIKGYEDELAKAKIERSAKALSELEVGANDRTPLDVTNLQNTAIV